MYTCTVFQSDAIGVVKGEPTLRGNFMRSTGCTPHPSTPAELYNICCRVAVSADKDDVEK